MASILRDWFVMLATTRMTKSFNMVLLREWFGPDAGLPGTSGRKKETATLCQELQNHSPGFGPLGISLNLGHVAASRIVIPITPTCTDAVLHVPHRGHGGTSSCMNRLSCS